MIAKCKDPTNCERRSECARTLESVQDHPHSVDPSVWPNRCFYYIPAEDYEKVVTRYENTI